MYGPWSGVVVASKRIPQGQELTFDYWSSAFKSSRSAVVVLPPEYGAEPTVDFPTLYLLHGTPGSDGDWLSAGAPTIAGEARSAGRMPPTVLVFPDGIGPRAGAEDHCADNYVPGDPLETDLIHDLVPSIEEHFRVIPDAGHRGIGGISSSGYGAANISLRHPGEFGLALVFAGDLTPEPTAFGGDEATMIANDPLRVVLGPKPAEAAAFFVGWGASDPLRFENRTFVARLRNSGYVVSSAVVSGAHTWDVWRRLLLTGLDAMGNQLGAPEQES